MNKKKERFIELISELPDDKVSAVFDIIADELIPHDPTKEQLSNGRATKLEKNGYIVLEFKVEDKTILKPNDNLTCYYGPKELKIKITDETLLERNYFLKNEELRIIGFVDDKQCKPIIIVTKEYYDMFDAFASIKEKRNAIFNFHSLSENEKNAIITQFNNGKYPRQQRIPRRLNDIDKLKFKFEMCRSAYTPQQQMDIEGMFDDVERMGGSGKERAKRKIQIITGIDQVTCPEIKGTKKELINKMDGRIHKNHPVKERLTDEVIASRYTDGEKPKILLKGPPGVGKTSIPEQFAEIIGWPFIKISLGSVSSMLDIVGDAPMYDASNVGQVADKFAKVGTTAAVVLLDQLDDAGEFSKDGGKVSKIFIDALSDKHEFKDNFLGTYINTKNTIWFATANDVDDIDPSILNRFTVIDVSEQSDEDKVEIAQKYILPRFYENCSIKSDEIIFDSEVLKYIINYFCVDAGCRDMKSNLNFLIKRIIAIWDESNERKPFVVTKKFVDSTLEDCVDENDLGIKYRRNIHLYPERVASEIKSLLIKCDKKNISDDEKGKLQRRLDYLVNLIPTGDAFSGFDEEKFYEIANSSHYGMEKPKREIAEIFFEKSINKKPLTSNRILFVGGKGIGKSSLVPSIAAGCGAKYEKISLNGLSDEQVIKGHSLTYISSDAGRIVKACRHMGTTKGILHLDEIDKILKTFGHDVANVLVDLLDDSAEFTDEYLGLPIDLSNILFIATANDLAAVNPIIRDRFTVINLEGYTESEKKIIVEDYLIPKIKADICPENIQIDFSDDAKEELLSRCRSFGVRDADKAVRRIIRNKLYNVRKSRKKAHIITIDDVNTVLGIRETERGNFPEEIYPGLTRGLAVTGENEGMSFAIETVVIPNDDSLVITGLPKESTIDSVKLAVSYIKRLYPGKLSNKGIHLHFGEGAVIKDGPSAGIAILISLLSACFENTVDSKNAFTGEINANGYIFNIGGVLSKIQAAEQAGCKRVFVPFGNYSQLSKETLSQFKINIVPVKHISEVIKATLPEISTDVA